MLINLFSNDLELSLPSYSDHRTCSQSVSNAISQSYGKHLEHYRKVLFYIEG